MKKSFTLGLVVIFISAIALFMIKGASIRKGSLPVAGNPFAISTGEGVTFVSPFSSTTASSFTNPFTQILNLGQKASTPEEAWIVFQKYLTFAKNHDLEGLKSVSYQLSPTCTDPLKQKECYQLMDSAYSFGIELKKADFINIWQDSKQIILFTNVIKQEVEVSRGYTKGVIYFTKDSAGNLKVLSFNPVYGAFTKIAGKTDVEIEATLTEMLKDTDQDGLDDQVEICKDQGPACVKTDPTKRDTNGNGWWDGIEALFYVKP